MQKNILNDKKNPTTFIKFCKNLWKCSVNSVQAFDFHNTKYFSSDTCNLMS